MRRENCPFCGYRWIRKSDESPIKCPSCRNMYYNQEDLAKRKKEKAKK